MRKQYENIIRLMKSSGGFIRTKDIIDKKIHNKYLAELVSQGILSRPKRGLYMLKNLSLSSSIVEASKMVPGGVLCLQSALAYYQISTVEPNKISFSIRQGEKVIIPEYPPIIIHHFSNVQYETGIKTVMIDGHKVKIYDLEKTICDIVRYRNKIGLDIMKQSLKDYLSRKEKNLTTLYKYAEKLRTKNILIKYMEVLA